MQYCTIHQNKYKLNESHTRRYIAQYFWRGYRDCIDIDVPADPVPKCSLAMYGIGAHRREMARSRVLTFLIWQLACSPASYGNLPNMAGPESECSENGGGGNGTGTGPPAPAGFIFERYSNCQYPRASYTGALFTAVVDGVGACHAVPPPGGTNSKGERSRKSLCRPLPHPLPLLAPPYTGSYSDACRCLI